MLNTTTTSDSYVQEIEGKFNKVEDAFEGARETVRKMHAIGVILQAPAIMEEKSGCNGDTVLGDLLINYSRELCDQVEETLDYFHEMRKAGILKINAIVESSNKSIRGAERVMFEVTIPQKRRLEELEKKLSDIDANEKAREIDTTVEQV